jgi:hypothetical protein
MSASDDGAGQLWLYLRANSEPGGWRGKSEGKIDQGAREGARKLIEEDLGSLTLAGKLEE